MRYIACFALILIVVIFEKCECSKDKPMEDIEAPPKCLDKEIKVDEEYVKAMKDCVLKFEKVSYEDEKEKFVCAMICSAKSSGLVGSDGKMSKDILAKIVNKIFPPAAAEQIIKSSNECVDKFGADLIMNENEKCLSALPLMECFGPAIRTPCGISD